MLYSSFSRSILAAVFSFIFWIKEWGDSPVIFFIFKNNFVRLSPNSAHNSVTLISPFPSSSLVCTILIIWSIKSWSSLLSVSCSALLFSNALYRSCNLKGLTPGNLIHSLSSSRLLRQQRCLRREISGLVQ